MDNPNDDPVKEVDAEETIEYEGITERYGRAYWHIGVERGEKGVITALYLIPAQQPEEDTIIKYEPYHEHASYNMDLSPDLLRSRDRKDRLSRSGQTYCEHHDLVEDAFCMPASSSKLEFREYGSGISIRVSR